MDTRQCGRQPAPGTVVGLAASALGAGGAALAALLALACWRQFRRQWASGLLEGSVQVSAGLEAIAWIGTGLLASWLAGLLLIGALASLPGRSTAPLRLGAARLAPRLGPRASALLIASALTLFPSAAAHAGSPGNSAAAHAGSPGNLAAPVASAGSVIDFPSRDAVVGPPADRPADGAPVPEASAVEVPSGAPEPGWRPTRAAPVPDPSAITLVSRGGAAPEAVVVRSGDTLWDIAARHLGEDADAAAIAAAWPRWHESNRAVIGEDPDHILPGTRLVPPAEVSP